MIVLILLFVFYTVYSQNTCVNSGFENGNFLHWNGSKGHTMICGDSVSLHPAYTPTATGIFSTYLNAHLTDKNAFHTIVDNSGNIASTSGAYYASVPFDSLARNITTNAYEIPLVCPFFSDNYSARLNNMYTYNTYQASQIQYTISNACSKKLECAFAVVLNDGGHPTGTNPFFQVRILDKYKQVLDSFLITLSSGDTALKPSPIGASGMSYSIYYRKWDKKTFDFTLPNYSYIDTAYIQFTTGYCCYGAHFAYAYIDAQCINISSQPCSTGINLYASNQNLEVFPNPADQFINILTANQYVLYSIFDVYGNHIMNGRLDSSAKQIYIGHLQEGVYFILLENKEGKFYRKMVIKR